MAKKRTQALSTDRQTNLLRQMGKLSEQLFQLDPISYSDPAEAMILTLANAMCAQYEKHRDEYEVWRTRINQIVANIELLVSITPPDNELADDWLRRALSPNPDRDSLKELSGAWIKLQSISTAAGFDLRTEQPEQHDAIESRLAALHTFLQKGDSEPLRTIARQSFYVEPVKFYRVGRTKGTTPINKYILKWVKDDKNLHGGKDGDSYERFIKAHEKMPSVRHWREWTDSLPAVGRGLEIEKRVKQQPEEVQAYEAMRGKSRIEGRDYIQKIRQNANGDY